MLACFFLAVTLFLQITETPATPDVLSKHYAEFATHEQFHGKPAPAIISGEEERSYRTMLREGAKQGPNFAGHYTIVQWGCGTECWQAAVVDAKTGRIYQLPSTTGPRSYYFESTWLHFRRDSRLLIMCTNCRLWADRECDQQYFVWNGETFMKIDRQPRRDPHQH